MTQRGFTFTDPVPEGPLPPVSGTTPTARHASYTGARSIIGVWTARQSAYLQLLRVSEALTDQEAAALLGWQLCSVNSVRGALGDRIVPEGFDRHEFTDTSGVARVTKRTRWRVRTHAD